MSKSLRFVMGLVIAPLALGACGSDNNAKPVDAGAPDGPQGPIVGGRLGAAIASAAAASSASAAAKAKAAGDQPPENGVFGPGDADRILAKDAPPKVEVISDGDGTKVQLAPKGDFPEQKSTVAIGLRVGQGRAPTIEFALSIKPEKSKDKPKDAKDAPAGGAAAVHMAATVTGTSVPGSQGASKDAEELAKMKGTVVRYDVAANGATSSYVIEPAKGLGDGVRWLLDELVDVMSMMSVVVPPKPVGVGAYWIVADRTKIPLGALAVGGLAADALNGLRYRVFKVQKIENEVVTLSVDVRQYSADQAVKVDAGGQKQDMSLEGLESQGKGTAVWSAGATLAVSGDIKPQMTLGLTPPGAPAGRGLRVPLELTATLGAGGGAAEKK